MKTFSQHKSTCIIENQKYFIFACWDSETKEGKESSIDFYDVFDASGNCLNLGNCFFHSPTAEEIKELLKTW